METVCPARIPLAHAHLPGTVYALAHSEDGYVFIGGNFRHYHVSYNTYVAGEGHLWNFVLWKPDNTWGAWGYTNVGNSTAQYVRSLVWTGGNLFYNYGSGGTLYAGGSFVIAGDYGTQNVASFHYHLGDRSVWEPVGYFFTQPVTDVAVDTSTGMVYAASEDYYNSVLYHIFQFDPATWAWKGIAMSGVATGTVSALAADARGNVFGGTTDWRPSYLPFRSFIQFHYVRLAGK